MTGPWTFTLPWRAGASDNGRSKYRLGQRRTVKGLRPSLYLAPEYRAAKDYWHAVARNARVAAKLGAPLTIPLCLTVRVWFPDQHTRDAGNLRKCLTDALTGVWYADDSQLWREVWERAGVTPGGRIEVTVAAHAIPHAGGET